MARKENKCVHIKDNMLYFYWYKRRYLHRSNNVKVKISSNKNSQNAMQGHLFSFAYDCSVGSVWRPVTSWTRYRKQPDCAGLNITQLIQPLLIGYIAKGLKKNNKKPNKKRSDEHGFGGVGNGSSNPHQHTNSVRRLF